MEKQSRIAGLDILRGTAVIFMMLDHLMYDLLALMPSLILCYPYDVLNFSYKYWNSDIRRYGRFIIIAIFLLLCGVCCSFSCNNLKRGIKLLAVSLGVTVATFVLGLIEGNLNETIVFGILHCIATALILIGLCEKLKLKREFYLFIGLAGVVIGGIIQIKCGTSFTDFGTEPFLLLFIKAVLGLKLIGGDCFGLLLYGGTVFCGVYIGKLLYPQRKAYVKGLSGKGPLAFLGRHSLAVYVLHQLVIPVILFLIFITLGFEPKF